MRDIDAVVRPDTEIGRMVYDMYRWMPGNSYNEKCRNVGLLIGEDGVSYKTIQHWLDGKSSINPAKLKVVRKAYYDWSDTVKAYFVQRLTRARTRQEEKDVDKELAENA